MSFYEKSDTKIKKVLESRAASTAILGKMRLFFCLKHIRRQKKMQYHVAYTDLFQLCFTHGGKRLHWRNKQFFTRWNKTHLQSLHPI